MEVSALTHTSAIAGLRGPSPLLRLQSDERLVALTRGGQPAAFEALCSRYQSRLLSFVRHMLGSREDAEDVLQEVFAAAFNAVLADEREINVRPWLYRIARNRSLNHLRRASAIGVDSMDVHFADHGLSTSDRVLRRESFRELLSDVGHLPETQRTALLLREIDALSYDQIADAMETTVPSVKSLLVRARISLAEAAEARRLSCVEVRLELGEAAEGLLKPSPPARRHVRECDRCRSFKEQLKHNNQALAAILPVGPIVLLKKLLLVKLGSTASAGSAHVAGGAGATVGAGAAAGVTAAGGASAGGIFTVGAGALATKAVAGLAAAAIVSAGAVAANQPSHHRRSAHPATAYVHVARYRSEPVVLSERAQPVSAVIDRPALIATHQPRRHRARAPKPAVATARIPLSPALPAQPLPVKPPPARGGQPEPAGTQVTSETAQLPATATAGAPPAPTTVAPGQAPTSTPAGAAAAGAPPSGASQPGAGSATPAAGLSAGARPSLHTASGATPARPLTHRASPHPAKHPRHPSPTAPVRRSSGARRPAPAAHHRHWRPALHPAR